MAEISSAQTPALGRKISKAKAVSAVAVSVTSHNSQNYPSSSQKSTDGAQNSGASAKSNDLHPESNSESEQEHSSSSSSSSNKSKQN
jgi:hypothetical protein